MAIEALMDVYFDWLYATGIGIVTLAKPVWNPTYVEFIFLFTILKCVLIGLLLK